MGGWEVKEGMSSSRWLLDAAATQPKQAEPRSSSSSSGRGGSSSESPAQQHIGTCGGVLERAAIRSQGGQALEHVIVPLLQQLLQACRAGRGQRRGGSGAWPAGGGWMGNS